MCTVTKEAFTAYKAASGCIVELTIPLGSLTNIGREDVADPKHAMFRTNKALVMKIYDKDTKEELLSTWSDYDSKFEYVVGKTVEPTKEYDPNPDNVFTYGIHFFLTKEAAYDYAWDSVEGLYRSWYANGRLSEMGMIKNELQDGEWKEWYRNGKLHEIQNWVNGCISGLWEEWDEDEDLHAIDFFEDDSTKTITYDKDKHEISYLYERVIDRRCISITKNFRRETEITLDEKRNQEKQLQEPGDLVLSPDYKPIIK